MRFLPWNASGDGDLLSGTPLEASFVWALSTRAALRGELQLGTKTFTFQCNKIHPGAGARWDNETLRPPSRLFPGTDNSEYDLSLVKDERYANAFFRVEEGAGRKKGAGLPTHPIADAWFKADVDGDDALVLLDFAGGGAKDVSRKFKKARNWRAAEQKTVWERDQLMLYVVILAPFADGYLQRDEPNEHVQVVFGKDARLLLGGLDQVSPWFRRR